MKLHFDMPVNVEPADEAQLAQEWLVSFSYDYDDGEISFESAHLRFEDELKFADFLEEVDKKGDEGFLSNLHQLAEAYVDLNLDDALNDFYARD